MSGVAILGTGFYTYNLICSNYELERKLDLPRNFIWRKTGILERKVSINEDHGLKCDGPLYIAVEEAVRNLKIDRIIIAREIISTDKAYPMGLKLIRAPGLETMFNEGCFSVDISNYCPGFVHAMNLAQLWVKDGQCKNVLIVAENDPTDYTFFDKKINKRFRDEDRDEVLKVSVGDNEEVEAFQNPALNAILWGAGVSAMVIGESEEKRFYNFRAKGSRDFKYEAFRIGELKDGRLFTELRGKTIERFACTEVPEFIHEYLTEGVDIIVPHQPNPKILGSLRARLGIREDKILVTCDTYGNMLPVSLPATYHLAKEKGKIKSGDKVLFCSFGDSYLQVAGVMYREP